MFLCVASRCGVAKPGGDRPNSDTKKVRPCYRRPWRSGSNSSEKEQTMPVSPVRDEYVIAGDLTFHYLQWGEQGSPIICAHGITANAFCFQALADELSSTHRVFAYDLRGRGDSDKPESGYSLSIH